VLNLVLEKASGFVHPILDDPSDDVQIRAVSGSASEDSAAA
jgi:hypothetical protein